MPLGDASPRQATNEPPHSAGGHAMFASQSFDCRAVHVLQANGAHLVGGELRPTVHLSLWAARAAFRAAVSHVLGVRPQEQVGWVATRRVIAAMKYRHDTRLTPVMQFPGDSVRCSHGAIKSELAIPPPLALGSQPFPAAIICPTTNLRPKTLVCGHAVNVASRALKTRRFTMKKVCK